MPKVSVIIPTYNCAEFLKNAIDSVLKQTYKDYEIIVVDDGSTDDTRHIVGQFDGNIRYFFQDNAGPAAARNAGIKNAAGKYIAFLDSDDYFFPEKLELQTAYIGRYPDMAMVFSDACTTYTDGTRIPHYKLIQEPHWGMIFDKLFLNNFINNSTVLLHKSYLEKTGLFDETIRYSEDYELYLRIAKNFPIGYIDKVLVKFDRTRQNRLTRNIEKLFESDIRILSRLIDGDSAYFSSRKYLIKERFSRLGFDFGWRYFNQNNLIKAREQFKFSIKYNRLFAKAHLFLLFTYFNRGTITLLKNVKRKYFSKLNYA